LGTRFLGHAERTGVILHLIDGTQSEIVKAYRTIRRELEEYGHGVGKKTEFVVLNKIDAIAKADLARKRKSLEKAAGRPVHAISGVSGEGVDALMRDIARVVEKNRARDRAREPKQRWAP
jgi:GTP-binding protein